MSDEISMKNTLTRSMRLHLYLLVVTLLTIGGTSHARTRDAERARITPLPPTARVAKDAGQTAATCVSVNDYVEVRRYLTKIEQCKEATPNDPTSAAPRREAWEAARKLQEVAKKQQGGSRDLTIEIPAESLTCSPLREPTLSSQLKALAARMQQDAVSVAGQQLRWLAPDACSASDAVKTEACWKSIDGICSNARGSDDKSPGVASVASGAAWQTALLQGLAERAGEEVALWLLQSFADKLCGSTTAPSRYFPASCQILDKKTGSPDMVPGVLFGSSLRKDLEHFPILAVRAIYKDSEDMKALYRLLKQPPSDAKQQFIAWVQSVATKADLSSACKEPGSEGDPVCVVGAAAVILSQVKQELDHPFAEDKVTCDRIAGYVNSSELQGGLRRLFNDRLPASIAKLFAEKPQCNTDTKPFYNVGRQPTFDLFYKSVKNSNVLVQQLQKRATDTKPATIAKLVHANIEAGLRLFESVGRFIGTEASLRAARSFVIAEGAGDTLDALFSVFEQLRSGGSPFELLSGLSLVAKQSPLPRLLCSEPETRNELGCTVVSTGTLLAEVGRIADLFAPDPSGILPIWDDKQVCSRMVNLLRDDNLKTALQTLYGEQLPQTVQLLLKDGADVQCTKVFESGAVEPAEHVRYQSLLPLRRVVRSIYDLEVQIRSWNKSDASLGRERVGQLLQLISGVVDASAGMLDQESDRDLRIAMSTLNVLGDMFLGKWADGVRGTMTLVASSVNPQALPEQLRAFLPLVADLAAAQDSKAVKAALQSAAAPLGSWRVRRQRTLLSITGVVGAQGSYEMPLQVPSGVNLQPGWTVGPMAAIGLELSFPLKCLQSSLGLFISALDVGQLALARVTGLDDQSQNQTMKGQQTKADVASNVDFLDVVAPGVYLKLGIAKTPLTFGFGPSLAPRLRKYSYTDPDGVVRNPDPFSMFRINMFLGVDLNLFPLL